VDAGGGMGRRRWHAAGYGSRVETRACIARPAGQGPWAHRLRFLRRLIIRPASTSSGGGTGGLRIHVGAVVLYVGAVAE